MAVREKVGAKAAPVKAAPRQERPWWAIALLVGMGVLFLWAVLALAPERSFHQDELTNFRMHALRERGENAESQHRHFHDFHAWWLSERADESHARLPSIVCSLVGYGLLVWLAWRLGGAWMALAVGAAWMLWPRSWDNALEMRYYGYIFMTSVAGLHCWLSITRGRVLWPFVVLGVLLLLVLGWHPTALPFHGGLLMLCAAAAAWGVGAEALARVRGTTADEEGPVPWRRLLPAALVVVLFVVGMAVAWPRLNAQLRVVDLIAETAEEKEFRLNPLDLGRWVIHWVDDRLAEPWPVVRVVRISFVALLAAGCVALVRRGAGLFLAGCGFLWVAQIGAAAATQGSWSRMATGYKYLTSSSPPLLLMLGAGALWLLTEANDRWGRRGLAGAGAALLLLFVVPLAPRLAFSALGDGSNFRAAWRLILDEAGERVPLVYGRSEFTQSTLHYQRLLGGFEVMMAVEHDLGSATIPYLAARGRPVFLAYPPALAETNVDARLYKPLEMWRSNFTPTWDLVVMTPRADVRLAAGGAAQLTGAAEVLFLEAGVWELLPADGGTPQTLEVAAGETRSLPPGMVRPHPDHEWERAAGFAVRGLLNRWNGPHGNGGYYLANNATVSYDLYLPEGVATHLLIKVMADTPAGGGFMMEIDGRLVGAWGVDPDAPAGASLAFALRVPDWAATGAIRRVAITNLGENSARRDDNDSVRMLKLLSLGMRRAADATAVGSAIAGADFAPPPSWAPHGEIPLAYPGTTKLFHPAAAGLPVSITNDGGILRFTLPNPMGFQAVYTVGFDVKPGMLLVPEIEVRCVNPGQTTIVPSIVFWNEKREQVGVDLVSQLPLGRDSTDWTRRIGLTMVPPKAKTAFMMFYLNSPENYTPEPDAGFEFRRIRLARTDAAAAEAHEE